MNFWDTLSKPFSVLAPMEDVTDTVFRQVVLLAGKPDVFFTEFTSVDGICSKGFEKVSQRLRFLSTERPLVGQIWGNKPELFYETAKILFDMGFDGIDINMGCPDRAVLKQGCGAALSRVEYRSMVREIILATKEGAGGLPVSVKTRLGDRGREAGWIEFLLEQELAALTIHARTAKEMSLVPADWNAIKQIVLDYNSRLSSKMLAGVPNIQGDMPALLADKSLYRTRIIGNGDIKTLDDPRIAESGVDGVMIGRGIFENPFVFSRGFPEKSKNLALLTTHLNLWKQTWADAKSFAIMKKFFKMYIRDFDGAAELRARLMETTQVDEALHCLIESTQS